MERAPFRLPWWQAYESPGKDSGMTRRTSAVVAALLSVLMMSSSALASPRRDERTVRERTIGAVMSLFPQVWNAIRSIYEKEGSSLDPFGNPKPNATEPPASGTSSTGTSSGQ
jgi:hypothetical protein